jgi:hypothetical protein
MSDNQQPHSQKKVTPATIDAPEEEFISPESVPSETESPTPQRESEGPRPPPAR